MGNNSYNLLAIETSCDETAAAVIRMARGEARILSNVVASQIDIYALTGGVVPEVAARAHIEKINPVIREALGEKFKNFKSIDVVAVTNGPGLVGSLLVGTETAKTIAWARDLPIIPINHIEAHIYANFIGENQKLKFPALCLVVSGGHTSLILMRDHGKYKTVGETLDDAAGEAFDKAAAILGLPYPGGPSIAKAAQSKIKTTEEKVKLPRPLIGEDNLNFSFSGLKTALLYTVRDLGKINKEMQAMLAGEFQQAAVDCLVEKTLRAAEKYKVKSICLAGGVAANSKLREEFKLRIKNYKLKINLHIPDVKLCTDNAAIVGICAAYKISSRGKSAFRQPEKIEVDANLYI